MEKCCAFALLRGVAPYEGYARIQGERAGVPTKSRKDRNIV
jgi:hypothetical protein